MGIGSLIKRSATAAALAACAWSTGADAAPLSRKPAGQSIPAGQSPSSRMIDIALDDNGVLRGRFVDTSGEPIDGAVVTLRQSERVVARSTTLRDGTFEIERVPSGTYRLLCGSASGQIRCWTSDAAPPNAVVDGVTFQDNVVRGQAVLLAPALLGSSAMTTAAASGAAIGGVATFAAVESRSNGAASNTPPEASSPAITQAPGHPNQIVGRDTEGNLIRIRGAAPWRQDSLSQALPPNAGVEFEDQVWPASP